MADTTDDFKAGCGCIFFIALAIGGIVTGIKGCCDEKRSESLRPDYSSRPSEEGLFEKSGYGFLDARGFRVADGIGYLTLNNGHVLKMWRNSYGEYEGRYNGRTYTAKKTANGYEVRSKR